MGAFCRPAHGLPLSHSLLHQVTHSRLRRRARYSQTIALSLTVVREAARIVSDVVEQVDEMPANSLDALGTRRAGLAGRTIDTSAEIYQSVQL
jgi:hypothetical protein